MAEQREFTKPTLLARVRILGTIWSEEVEHATGKFDDGRAWNRWTFECLDEDMNKVTVRCTEESLSQASKLAKGEKVWLTVDVTSDKRFGLVSVAPVAGAAK